MNKISSKNQMTTKERWLAAIRKRPLDRLPFWPKIISNAYQKAQSYPFNKMEIDEIIDWIGGDKHIFISPAIVERRSNTSEEITEKSGFKKIRYHTKYGSTENILKYDEGSDSWHPIKMAISNPKEIEIMIAYYSDCKIGLDKKEYEKALDIKRKIGQDAVFVTVIGESPLMDFVEWLAGVQNAHILLNDYKDKVEELFHSMHEVLLTKTKLVSENNPADLFYFIENTSTTLISPEQFLRYPFKHLNEYGKIIKENDGIFIMHMCGHLKSLLKDINHINADAIEAFTSPPVGNTRFIDGKTECPSKCLIGGTNAMLWTKSSNEIISEIEKDLNSLLDHRGIAVTPAGIMPPICKPETIREVCKFVKSYRIRI